MSYPQFVYNFLNPFCVFYAYMCRENSFFFVLWYIKVSTNNKPPQSEIFFPAEEHKKRRKMLGDVEVINFLFKFNFEKNHIWMASNSSPALLWFCPESPSNHPKTSTNSIKEVGTISIGIFGFNFSLHLLGMKF